MTRPLWTLDELFAVTGGTLDLPNQKAGGPAGVPPVGHETSPVRAGGATITGISIDTRSLSPDDLFVPLTDARDGHDFVTAAFGRGAAAALVRNSYTRKQGDGALIRVPVSGKADDVLAALERVGIAARARLSSDARVVAVTGSAGKTGTTAMLRACLATCGKVHAPDKSFNNHWGVPLTLARMPADTRFGIFEIGMNHAGEISPLTRMVRPHVAIITNVLPVHVGNFPDGIEGVARAKAEIFEGLEPGGVAIIHGIDHEKFKVVGSIVAAKNVDTRLFGSSNDQGCHAWTRWVRANREAQGSEISAVINKQALTYSLGIAGEHIATNSLAVLLCLDALHQLNPTSIEALKDLQAGAGRGARVRLQIGADFLSLVDESYNANPESMRWSLITAAQLVEAPGSPDDRFVAVLGDMLELGPDAADYHVGLKDVAERADLVFACGPMMKHLFEALPPSRRGAWAPTSAELIPHVLGAIGAGDVVMVKGSLGSRMAPIVEAIKNRFAVTASSV